MAGEFNMSNPVFKAFAQCGALLVLKMFFVVFATAFTRMRNKAFANEEDTVSPLGKGKKVAVNMNHPDVERIRRVHQNDLENIPAFLLLGFLYVASGPELSSALLHFRIFTVARFLHTLVYMLAIRQPARALTFMTGLVTCISMAVQILQQTAK